MTRHLVVMLKEPVAGRVKTRLGQGIGMTQAAWWFRHQTRKLLQRVDDPRWRLWLAVSPDRAGMTSRVWPDHLPRIPQGRGDLGDRMGRIFRSMPRGPVCIIGGDIPDVRPTHIERAFRILGDHDAVFGPATDGGYWLVGMKRVSAVPLGIFEGVRWSSEHALRDSVTTLGSQSVGYCDQLADVDSLEDLRAFEQRTRRAPVR